MVSEAKRTKNTAIIVRKARTGTQCLSCSWWTRPDHCSENFERGHLRSLPKLSKISIERWNFSLLQKRQFEDLFLVRNNSSTCAFLRTVDAATCNWAAAVWDQEACCFPEPSMWDDTHRNYSQDFSLFFFLLWLNSLVEGIKKNDNIHDHIAGSQVCILIFLYFLRWHFKMRSFLRCFPYPRLFIHQESKCEIFITIKIGGKL